MKKLVSTRRSGFQITFENGLTASVQWGAGTYSDNHYSANMDFTFSKDAESDTAEVAVLKDDELIDATPFVYGESGYDDVVGHLTPEQIVDFLANVKNWRAE